MVDTLMISMTRITRLIFAAFSAAALPTLFTGCNHHADGGPADQAGGLPPVRVTAIQPVRKTLVRTVELPGRTEAYEFTPLHAKVTGYVQSIFVDIGDRIRGPHGDEPGTVLCELEVPELKEELSEKVAAVAQAEAEVDQAESAVNVAEAMLRSAQARLREAQAMAAREEATYQRWHSEFQRIRKLADTGAVTAKVADETKSELEAADAGRKEVAARIASADALEQQAAAQVAKSKADVVAMRSHLGVAEAEQRRLEALIKYAVIRAPYDGVVVERNVHTGHLVQAGGGGNEKPLLTVMRVDPIRVFVDVPESDAVYVSPGNPVKLWIPALAGAPYVGEVTRISWSLNETSRTLMIEIDVPNPEGNWRPGQFVSAQITVAELPDVFSLPKTAIITQDKQTYCFVIQPDGKLVRRQVALGLQAGNEFEVREGLSEGERVIGVNASAFREGQSVEIAEPSERQGR